MKKVITGLVLLLIVWACGKNFIESEDIKYNKLNREDIIAYLAANNLNFNEHTASGIFWNIDISNPDGDSATAEHSIHLAYTMKSLSGVNLIVVKPEDSLFYNSGLAATAFEGFVRAVNTLKEGEKGTFLIPSSLAFAANPPSGFQIKAWEALILEMENIKIYTEDDLIERFLIGKGITETEVTDLGVHIFRTQDRPAAGDLIAGDAVTVNYKGYFLNGTSFDEGTLEYVVGSDGVIPGFADGISHMRVGEKASIIIPWLHAYGENGNSAIPGKTTLVFDLEIVSKN